MWELFTLGRMPYTGMESNGALFQRISGGYRLEKPEYSTEAIYDIMLSCWYMEPRMRPIFNKLEKKLKNLLEDSVKDVRLFYLDLNITILINVLKSNFSNTLNWMKFT